MSPPPHFVKEEGDFVDAVDEQREVSAADPDAEFGGYEERRRLERKLLWKLDCRMSVLVVIYILNYVNLLCHYRD